MLYKKKHNNKNNNNNNIGSTRRNPYWYVDKQNKRVNITLIKSTFKNINELEKTLFEFTRSPEMALQLINNNDDNYR